MLKPQDIVVLLKLVDQPESWTFEKLGEELDLSPSAVHRSLDRAQQAGLFDAGRRKINRAALLDLLVHGAKYFFPPIMHGEARGFATAWAAPPLAKRLSSSRQNVPVWPHPKGDVRGIALEPLYPVVPDAASRDPQLAELLALFDAIRIGNARERALASEEIQQHLGATPLPT